MAFDCRAACTDGGCHEAGVCGAALVRDEPVNQALEERSILGSDAPLLGAGGPL
jgi:hypothetical protein